MATKNYMINDKWLDLDKQNIIELQSVDGELDSLKVNGYEIVEPSGKITITENGTDIDIAQYATADVNVSSDFSIADVHFVNTTANAVETQPFAQILEEEFLVWTEGAYVEGNGDAHYSAVLYKGSTHFEIDTASAVNVTGSATYEDGTLTVTGDCEVTIG